MRIFELDNISTQQNRDDSAEAKLSEPETNAAFTFFQNKGYYELWSTLKNLGWSYLNEGCFSYVFYNPTKPYVLKLNFNEDIGFANYARFISDHPNRYFPRISDAKTLKVEDEEYEVYLIEKLYHYASEEGREYARIVKAIVTTPNRPIRQLFPYGAPSFILENPELIEALKLIRKFSRQTGYKVDLHSQNIMQRENGDMVITDPYSFPITGEDDEIEDTYRSS